MLLFQAVSRLHCGGFCEQTAEEESGDQALPLPLTVQVLHRYTVSSYSLAHLGSLSLCMDLDIVADPVLL
jgi:hypothetical protein